jgi:transcriptional regulator with XRE-family HTH domain
MTPANFKQARKELGLTQSQLARELGLSAKNGDRYIRGIESGRDDPSGLLLKALEYLVTIKGLEEFINKRKEGL